jgi:hypothetical protein
MGTGPAAGRDRAAGGRFRRRTMTAIIPAITSRTITPAMM